MEEASENSKESSNSAQASGMGEYYFLESLCKHDFYAHSLCCERLLLALSYLPICKHVSVLLTLDGIL